MKFFLKLKTLMVAAAAVFILAAPAYSWTHDGNRGWDRPHHRHYSGYAYENRVYGDPAWNGWTSRAWYPERHRHWSEAPIPAYGAGIPIGIYFPGFSVYVGP